MCARAVFRVGNADKRTLQWNGFQSKTDDKYPFVNETNLWSATKRRFIADKLSAWRSSAVVQSTRLLWMTFIQICWTDFAFWNPELSKWMNERLSDSTIKSRSNDQCAITSNRVPSIAVLFVHSKSFIQSIWITVQMFKNVRNVRLNDNKWRSSAEKHTCIRHRCRHHTQRNQRSMSAMRTNRPFRAETIQIGDESRLNTSQDGRVV